MKPASLGVCAVRFNRQRSTTRICSAPSAVATKLLTRPSMPARQDIFAAPSRLSWRATRSAIHCRNQHTSTTSLCAECQGLLSYAKVRLNRCRFGEAKPTCVKCPVHCYPKTRREQIRVMMRYAGPRMLGNHPIMSLRHWLAGFHKAPER